MMKKGFFDKVFVPGGTIDCQDLMGEERARFLSIMEDDFGYNKAALSNRLFYRGFDAWMLKGVDAIKDDFAKKYPELAEWREDAVHSFFEQVGKKLEQKNTFYQFIASYGMKSSSVIRRRFTDEDWKPWERIGMEKILTDYCDRY